VTENLYWGEPWDAPICEELARSNTYPLGEKCLLCGVTIVEGESGTYVGTMGLRPPPYALATTEPVHKECSLRSVMGGIGHLVDHDRWCVERGDPNGGLPYRESALLVWTFSAGARLGIAVLRDLLEDAHEMRVS
jgi:hypothetical protein